MYPRAALASPVCKVISGILAISLLLWLCYELIIDTIEIELLERPFRKQPHGVGFVERAKVEAFDRYNARRSAVQEFCDAHMGIDDELVEVNTDPKWKQDLWFDNQNHLLYCQISKVSSSTWVAHLLKLHGKDVKSYVSMLQSQGFGQMSWRPQMRRRMFQLLDDSVPQANDRLFSFVFVREPFERIVSSYYNKMYGDWKKMTGHDMRWMRDDIIKTYRGIDPKSTGEMPTPTEFIQYIVDQGEKQGPHRLDNHIKPMWSACPFCLVQFDVIGHIEDFDHDSLFILDTMNLTERVDSDLHRNNNQHVAIDRDERMIAFFNDVPKPLVQKLFEYCQKDYEMLGYPVPSKYLE